jgi:hypothetical protein
MTDQNQTTANPTAIPADQYEKNKIMDQVALVSFVDDLIRDRKDANITDANVAEIRAMLLKKVNEEINTHMINCLTDKERVELDTMLDKNPTDKELHEYFVSKIPNLSTEIASVMLRFRAAYLLPVTTSELESVSHGTASVVASVDVAESVKTADVKVNPLDDTRPAPYKPEETSNPPDVLPPAPVMGKPVN